MRREKVEGVEGEGCGLACGWPVARVQVWRVQVQPVDLSRAQKPMADVQPRHAPHVALHRAAALDLAEQREVRSEGVDAAPGLLEVAKSSEVVK